jgi:hypothetical protein
MYQERMREALRNTKAEPYALTSFNEWPELAKRFVGKAKYELPE